MNVTVYNIIKYMVAIITTIAYFECNIYIFMKPCSPGKGIWHLKRNDDCIFIKMVLYMFVGKTESCKIIFPIIQFDRCWQGIYHMWLTIIGAVWECNSDCDHKPFKSIILWKPDQVVNVASCIMRGLKRIGAYIQWYPY